MKNLKRLAIETTLFFTAFFCFVIACAIVASDKI
jgi:hypothetical protein